MINDKLLQLKRLLPVIKQMTLPNTSICLYEKTGKLLGIVRTDTIQVPFNEGDVVDFHVPQFAEVLECLNTGKTIHNVLPRAIFGTAMEGDIIPVVDGGEVQGVVITFFSTEIEEQIKEKSDILKDDILSVDTAVKSIGSSSENLTYAIHDIHTASQAVEEKIKETTEITKIVSRSATRSNVLALNASIEAARAGTAGRGFAVVASEMGKFSKESVELARRIDETLAGVSELIGEVKEAIVTSSEVADHQASTVEEIILSLASVSTEAKELANLSKRGTNLQ